MYFAPFIIEPNANVQVPVTIIPATPEDIAATHGTPAWQTQWDSDYLMDESIEKYAMKTEDGTLVALGAYQITARHAYVYIVYLESAPHSNPTLTVQRKYYGIGTAMIAFGIKFSIDHGCRGVVVFDAKTDELAKHYQQDFHALPLPGSRRGGPKQFMLADQEAWALFSTFLTEEVSE